MKNEYEVQYAKYFGTILDAGPNILKEYIVYITTINGFATRTAANYYRDLILFFKFVLTSRGKEFDLSELKVEEEYDQVVALLAPEINEVFVRSIRRDDIIHFLYHLNADNENSSTSRNRRLSAIRSFFNYVDSELNIIDFNPSTYIKRARKDETLPKYLTLQESLALLAAVPPTENYERDFCILTFFLNFGLRLSELVSINLQDIRDGTLKIHGKGSKERILFFNESCTVAYNQYLDKRMSAYLIKKEYRDALFVSERGRRLSCKRVYDIVMDCLARAGLSQKGFTPHKLRHTAATLMYQSGADIRSLKDVLGHEGLETTQIYTHVSNELIREATNKNPLSGVKKEDLNSEG